MFVVNIAFALQLSDELVTCDYKYPLQACTIDIVHIAILIMVSLIVFMQSRYSSRLI